MISKFNQFFEFGFSQVSTIEPAWCDRFSGQTEGDNIIRIIALLGCFNKYLFVIGLLKSDHKNINITLTNDYIKRAVFTIQQNTINNGQSQKIFFSFVQ